MMNQRYFTFNEKVNLDSKESLSNSDEFDLSDNCEIDGQGYLQQLLEGVHNGRRITSKTRRSKVKTKMKPLTARNIFKNDATIELADNSFRNNASHQMTGNS